MKLSILLLLVSLISFFSVTSCTKDNVATVTKTDTITVAKTDTVTIYTNSANNSILYLFTGKQWIYDSVYNNYTDPGTGTLVYVKGGNNNTVNYDGDRDVYWMDGGADSFGPGNYYSYSWAFTNPSDSTELVFNNTITDYGRILRLDANYLTLYDSTNKSLDFCVAKP